MADETTLNDEPIAKLERIFKTAFPVAQVGILGAKDSREGLSNSNATVGACHEFGTEHIAQRSFLRMPLNEHLSEAITKSGLSSEDTLKDVLSSGDAVPWMKQIAVVAEGVVKEAFASGGFGKWQAHAPGYTNNTGQLLVDTQQLRNSITHSVVTTGKTK